MPTTAGARHQACTRACTSTGSSRGKCIAFPAVNPQARHRHENCLLSIWDSTHGVYTKHSSTSSATPKPDRSSPFLCRRILNLIKAEGTIPIHYQVNTLSHTTQQQAYQQTRLYAHLDTGRCLPPCLFCLVSKSLAAAAPGVARPYRPPQAVAQ
jgi:hypothetical protein